MVISGVYKMKIALILISLFLKNVLAANILFSSHPPSPSHHIWNRALALSLVRKGHNVTMISHDKEKLTPPKNFTLILLEGIYKNIDFDLDEIVENSAFANFKVVYDWSYYACTHDLKTQGLQTLLDYPEDYKFDLIIFDVTVGQCLYPIIERFHNPPVVGVTAFLIPPALSLSFGNPLQTAYMPYYGTTYSDKMSFTERLLNFLYTYADVLYRTYVELPAEMKLAQNFFGNNIRPLEEVERNISLLLTNSDPVLTYPLDLPPNIIHAGGMHILPPKALPEDLQQIMDDAKDGVILFSLGSNLRSDKLSATKRKIFLDAFRKLPQRVLWKFESDDLEGLPENVIIRKWLPQNDLLGHPKTKLFITHGGGLSTQEIIYHAVPTVGIPFFIDHLANVARLVNKKMGIFVDFRKLTAQNLYEAITEVLSNPIYSENVKSASRKFRDQPQSPLERATFWVEYVLHHGSADHLVLAARDMPFYQTASLDVLAVLILGVAAVYSLIILVFTGCKFVRTVIFGSSPVLNRN